MPARPRPLPRWLFVAAAVGVIGVGIDLLHGPPANALPMHATPIFAPAALPLDHSVVAGLTDESPLAPGAAVAAYER